MMQQEGEGTCVEASVMPHNTKEEEEEEKSDNRMTAQVKTRPPVSVIPGQPTQILQAEIEKDSEKATSTFYRDDASLSCAVDDRVATEFNTRGEAVNGISRDRNQHQKQQSADSDEETYPMFRLRGVTKKKAQTAPKVSVRWKTKVTEAAVNSNTDQGKSLNQQTQHDVQLHPRSLSQRPISFDEDEDVLSTACYPAMNSSDAYDDMLDFYSCAHHDQDEAYIGRALKEQAKKTEHALGLLHASFEKTKKQLNNMLSQKWSAETEAFQKRAKEKHIVMMKKQKFQRAQLTLTQEKRLESFRNKIQERITHLTNTISVPLPTPDAKVEAQQQLKYWQKYEQDERQKLQQRFQEQLQMLRTHHSMRQEELLLEFTEEKARIKAARQQQLQYHINFFRLKAEKKRQKVLKKFETNRYYRHDLEQHEENEHAEHSLISKHQKFNIDVEAEDLCSQPVIPGNNIKNDAATSETTAKGSPLAPCSTAMSPSHTNEFVEMQATASSLVSEDQNILTPITANLVNDKALAKSSLYVSAENSNDKKDGNIRSSSLFFSAPVVLPTAGRSDCSASYIRQNMRKTVSSGLPVQLAIDLHNEGIVVHYRSTSDNYNEECRGSDGDEIADAHSTPVISERQQSTLSADNADNLSNKSAEIKIDADKTDDNLNSNRSKSDTVTSDKIGGKWSSSHVGGKSEFIAWGVRARQLLHSVLCGEIPKDYSGNEIGSDVNGALPGGLIKCMVTDMRTSDGVASAQRALVAQSANKKKIGSRSFDPVKEMVKLDMQIVEGQERETTARSENEQAYKEYENLRWKTSHYWQPVDGNFIQKPLVPIDRSNLESFMRAKERFAIADGTLKDATALVNDLKSKKEEINRQIGPLEVESRDSSISDRIANVLSVIRATMEQRRLQLDKKRVEHKPFDFRQTSSLDLELALKASFRHKMEHRRLVIVLRPSGMGMLSEVKKSAYELMKGANLTSAIDEKAMLLRVEQLLLLALHPVAPEEGLPTIPLVNKSKPWGEAGWHLELKVDPPKSSSFSTMNSLPTLYLPSTFRNSLADCTSAPGRQSSALLPACFFRMLTAPLSKLCQASAPAEPQDKPFDHARLEFDPFRTNEKEMIVGYQFATPLPPKISATSTRSKRSGTKEGGPEDLTSCLKKPRRTSSRKLGKEDSLFHSSSKPSNPTKADDSAATDRQNRINKASRTLQQSPPVVAHLNRLSPLMVSEISIPQTVQQPAVGGQPHQQHQQGAAQTLFNAQNRSFVVEPIHQQPHHQHQAPQQQHHQTEFLRHLSNPSQPTMPSSSRTVQTIPLMNPTISQTPQPIPQYFHHPQPPQAQQQPTVTAAQQVRQQQLLQQQQQRQIAQMQRVMQAPSQQLSQTYPFSGQAVYSQPPPFPHVSHAGSTAPMVLPPMQSQSVNNAYGLPHPPQQQPSQGQNGTRNAEEDYDPLFMLFNQ